MRKSCYDCELYCDECGGNVRDEICEKFEEMSEYAKLEFQIYSDSELYEDMSELEAYIYDETIKAELGEYGYDEESEREDFLEDADWED